MFSVIIPLYNKQSSVDKTIRSVLAQSCQDFEVIVVDDGSTDNSVDVVLNIQDPRINIIRQGNGGPSKARNNGVMHAKGDWILFLDADDELLPDALTIFSNLIYKYPSEKCFAGNHYRVYNGKKTLYSVFYKEKIIKNPLWAINFRLLNTRAGAAVVHKSVVNEFMYAEYLKRYEDTEWSLRVMKKYNYVRHPAPVMKYNIDCAEASKKRKKIAEDYLGYLNLNADLWSERLVLYKLYVQSKFLYPDESKQLYSHKLSTIDNSVLSLLYLLSRIWDKYINCLTKLTSYIHSERDGVSGE